MKNHQDRINELQRIIEYAEKRIKDLMELDSKDERPCVPHNNFFVNNDWEIVTSQKTSPTNYRFKGTLKECRQHIRLELDKT